jgi:hypothetical protein
VVVVGVVVVVGIRLTLEIAPQDVVLQQRAPLQARECSQ